MEIKNIQSSQIELTSAIERYIQGRVSAVAKLTDKFDPCELTIHVKKTTGRQKKGQVFSMEMNMTIPGRSFRAEAKRDDLYAAVDEATDDLKRQVRKHKEKMQDAERRG